MCDGTLSRLRPNKPKKAPSGWGMALVNKCLIPSEREAFGSWSESDRMGYDLSVDEMVTRRREANMFPGEPIEPDIERMMEDIEQILLPSKKTPIPTAAIIGRLDLEFLESMLLKFYKTTPHYPPTTMLRGILLQRRKKLGWRGLKRYLIAYPDDARRLGFVDEDGIVHIPSHEQFRTFVQNRIDWDNLRDAIITELQAAGRENGIKIGSETVEDATMIETIENDPDGKYNGHYEKKGLKEDIITCRKTGLPLMNATIGGTECEGHFLIEQLEHLRELGIQVTDHWIDGTYATFENIATCQALLGTTLHYQVQEGWVIKDDGEPEHIKKLYQSFWKDSEFSQNEDLDDMMAFLARRGRDLVTEGRSLQQAALSEGAWGDGKRKKRGRPSNNELAAQARFNKGQSIINRGMALLEPVGAYYRNAVMRRAKEDPEWMKKDKGKRQLAESINNHLKNDLGLQDDLRVKGIRKVHIHTTIGAVFLLLIGLHKVRHGVRKDLASIVGIE